MCSWATNVGAKSRLAEAFAVCKLTDITLLFLAVRVAPHKEGSYFYPRKATFIRFRHFFNPFHGNLPVIIPCAFPFLDGVSRQD